eukprot:514878-Alexandrium_andersonii.AAC.1
MSVDFAHQNAIQAPHQEHRRAQQAHTHLPTACPNALRPPRLSDLPYLRVVQIPQVSRQAHMQHGQPARISDESSTHIYFGQSEATCCSGSAMGPKRARTAAGALSVPDALTVLKGALLPQDVDRSKESGALFQQADDNSTSS